MSIKTQLSADIKTAMRDGDKARLGVLRLASAAIKQREVDSRTELDDAGVLAVIEKMIKQGKDAAAQFDAAARPELAAKERAEIAVLEQYMPEPLTDAEIRQIIEDAMAATGAVSMRDMGKVMAAVKGAAAGRVDMAAVNQLVKARLQPE